jgi:glycosyltransferase involved in cell wall biosynthesis
MHDNAGQNRKPLISIVTPCFNEEENVDRLYEEVKSVFADLPSYSYEHIFIDNASTDATVKKVKVIAERDSNVKLIVNTRNFGHIRSPIHALFQSHGDAAIVMAADFQDPPEMIPQFIAKWEEGYRVVVGTKPESKESTLMFWIRGLYYKVVGRISDVKLIPQYTGFGLYDRRVVDILKKLDDPYPYFRGLIADIGFDYASIPYVQPRRERGITKNNFYTLYDIAMLGITSYSKVPIRLAAMGGFALSILSLLISLGYLVAKLIFWSSFSFGLAPVLIGLFFFASVQLFFIGLLGEYVAAIHTQVLKRPLVVEKERVNFDDESL